MNYKTNKERDKKTRKQKKQIEGKNKIIWKTKIVIKNFRSEERRVGKECLL